MSQISQPSSGGGGPIPPEVPTSFVTEDGTAIPAANVLNVFGRDTVENDVENIRTVADPDMGDDLYVELTNRVRGTVQTIGATSGVVFTFTMGATPGIYTFDVIIQALKTDKTSGAGFNLFGTARTSGAAATVIGIPDKITNNDDPTLNGVDVGMTAAGNTVQFTVTGIAAQTLDWSAAGFYALLT